MTRLHGRVVASTRGEPDDALEGALRRLGAGVVHWPTVRFEPAVDPEPLRRALTTLLPGDWVFFTSRRAVDASAALAPPPPPGVGVAAVGSSTASALDEAGWKVSLHGDGGAAELVEAWVARGGRAGGRVIFPAGSLARNTLEGTLSECGALVERIEAYRTFPSPPDRAVVLADLARGVDVVTFASPSAVHSLRDSLGSDWAGALARRPVAVIGATTLGALADCGVDLSFVVTAPATSMEGLAEAAAMAAELAAPSNTEEQR